MKLSDHYLNMAYIYAMINQIKDQYIKQGYKDITGDNGQNKFDLLMMKDNIIKAFEFKFSSISSNKIQSKLFASIDKFIEAAKSIGAEPIVIYVNNQLHSNVEFDMLGELICDYLINDDFPDQLDSLSTHTRIEEVDIEHISEISLLDDYIEIVANASIDVLLQYGSNREREEDDEMSYTFPLSFTVKLDWDKEIQEINYEINTDSFY